MSAGARAGARLTAGFVIANTLLLWAATALAALAMWPIYQDRHFIVMVAAATALGSAIAILGAVLRWRSYVVLLVGLAVFVLAGVALAVPGRALWGVLPSLDGIRELLAGVALGWKQLLTISLPVGDYQALLVPAYVLVLGGTIASLSVALRARYGELAVIGPIVLFLTGIAFGPQSVPWPIPGALGMLAVVLLWLSWRRWRRRREAIRSLQPQTRGPVVAGTGVRTLIAGGALLAVAATASVGAAVALPPAGERDVLRTSIEQPFDPRAFASPLSGFRRYLHDDRADRTMFTVSGLPRNARIRIATLDSYDGVVYAVGSDQVDSASGSFVRIPAGVDQSTVEGDRVEITVEIGAYTGVWLPTVGLFESVDFEGDRVATLRDGFYYNDVSGTAADIAGLRQGDEYRLEAVIPEQPTLAQLADATPGAADVPRLGELPAELALALDAYVQGIADPGDRLVAALEGLKRDGYISHGLGEDEPTSRSGHAADRITELFTAPRMIGDAEQYAVAAALMARQLGFPARVVFGFAPSGSGQVVVHGDDVSAWIEVNTAEYGWVTLDPVPEERPIPEEEPEDPAQVARPQSIVPPPPDRQDADQAQSAPDSERDEPDGVDPVLQAILAVLRIGGLVLGVAGVLMAPFLFIVAAKLRRRRLRRTAPDPLQRIRGGWEEFADTVVDHGYSPPEAATRSELAGVVGTLPSRVLAAVADRAVFAPEDPDPVDADHVWDAVGDLRAVLDGNTNRRGRVKALVSLRSLGGYSVRNLIKGTRE
ncbi:MAG: transglutaminase domain-containing protein [Microbacteriaceae bacterium]|nr:transglutaminase domain-containing protein [Microbacteriaceae bacterium]